MTTVELFNEFWGSILLPLLSAVAVFVVWVLNAKKNELIAKVNNETYKKYLEMLNTTITDCVIATTQTYVESLKNEGKFDKEAQKKAFKLTYDNVIDILADDAKEYLNEGLGDLEGYITAKIESEVNVNKY